MIFRVIPEYRGTCSLTIWEFCQERFGFRTILSVFVMSMRCIEMDTELCQQSRLNRRVQVCWC